MGRQVCWIQSIDLIDIGLIDPIDRSKKSIDFIKPKKYKIFY